jgi:hypothetical protein
LVQTFLSTWRLCLKIFVNGGLGNQLFQVAYAHQGLESSEQKIQIVGDPSPRVDRPFDLIPFLEACEHAKSVRIGINLFGKITYQIQRVVNKLLPKSYLALIGLNRNVFTEHLPFNYVIPGINDHRMQVGYFQHWKYIESVWETFGLDLENAINRIILPVEIGRLNLDETCIVHIRRGDLIRSVGTMGILDLNYYRNAISRIKEKEFGNLKLVGITDDFAGAKKISEELGLDLLLGPSELSSWQSIALMAKSKAVVCANSTFSWWGGILSAKKGGAVAIPNPWFVNWHEEVGDAFLHPNLLPVNSSFLKMKDFETDFKD